ncbi:hypothetical protein [Bradyrhizobium sp. NP1]|uniref:hypothetical protein n=1 Tax=Bradyrhizobium sp. NP1 TaxID=3049772 RepID=UPI0025A51D7B|nr:hypothetical protein [Bradyrhizobium sp. NP1]WJR75837.1 hypothetical protein QOU61_24025 [Bradyrhizobium sp. NP1]
MTTTFRALTIIGALSLVTLGSLDPASATDTDVPTKAMKAKPVADQPFFLLIDNRVTYSYLPKGTDPGSFTIQPNGTINGKTAKQVYSFTHFDIWAYGTNFFTISMLKSDHNNPANGCVFNNGSCAGATDVYGLIRSTFGFNEIFGTKAFSVGPLRNISFEIGADAQVENIALAPSKRDVVAGLQFAFDLPYHGFFNVAPLYYKEINHNAFVQCGFTVSPVCLSDGNTEYKGTWALETNYYMDLGFLPETIRYFSISGRAGWYGPKGPENSPLPFAPPFNIQTKTEFNSEPIRLTFDASRAFMGPKYTHLVDVWVAYRYWQNKYGMDHTNSRICNVAPGVSNGSCTESSVYSGVTVKF